MGGDHGVSVVVPAAINALKQHLNLKLILVGDQVLISSQLSSLNISLPHERLSIVHTTQQVEMNESPTLALRNKKDSSMRVSMNLLKQGVVQAVVSAGNTGALMATAHFVLKTIRGIERPAIMAHMPADNTLGLVRVLDMGANVDSTPEQLIQFAMMGSVLAKAISHIDQPRVALLNIGEEEIKGNEQIKQTAELLMQNKMLNYVGFAEGNDIFKDVADVIVCDGFVGNIALKTAEGTAKFITRMMKEEFKRSFFTKFLALLSFPILKALARRLDPAKYNGASLLGLKGIVVKSHGGANIKGFSSAIEHAVREIEGDVIHLIEEGISKLLENNHV